MEDPFIAVIVNHTGDYFKSFSSYSGNSWTSNIKSAKVYTKLSGARTRVTLIYQWNKHQKISVPIPEIRQFFISGFIDIDQTERIALAAEKEEKRRLESENHMIVWRKEQVQRDYDRVKSELDSLAKKLQHK